MFHPQNFDIEVAKNAAFPSDQWGISVDLTDQRIIMQVRQWEGTPGDPYISIASDDETGDRIQILTIDTVRPETVFVFFIAKATHEDLPAPAKVNDRAVFRYDLLIGPAGAEEVYLFGKYIVRTGVTR